MDLIRLAFEAKNSIRKAQMNNGGLSITFNYLLKILKEL